MGYKSQWQSLILMLKIVPTYTHDSNIIIQVVLTDENDNAPRFTGTRFLASVAEGKPAGTFVYQVSTISLT